MKWEPRNRLGVSLIPASSHHRTGIDLAYRRPNELLTVRLFGWALCLFCPRLTRWPD